MDYSEVLPNLKGKDIYLYLTESLPDWTSGADVGLVLHYGGMKALLPLDDDKNLSYLASSFHHLIDEKSILISWNAKDIFSFIRGRTEISLEANNVIYDLSLICSYLGMPKDRPLTFKDAISVLKSAFTDSGWKKFSRLYSEVYFPLFTRVLPEIETNCLVDNRRRRCVYPTYVIEGQSNGRLKTAKLGENSYNPHSMGEAERLNLRPPGYDEVFVYFDYRNMEVNVLQWLSRDEGLGGILESGEDLYKSIWRKITKKEATDAHRKLCKDVFLPVVFGMGKGSLSKRLGVSEEFASKLIDSLVRTFPVAFDWVNSQSFDSNKTATDAFGRKRRFEDHEQYKAKNFCIQSPSSMICLRKLVQLHDALAGKASICYHLHDGYCVICNKNEVATVSDIGIKCLEEEDDLFPGLKLKTSCKFGHSLNDLQTLTRRIEYEDNSRFVSGN